MNNPKSKIRVPSGPPKSSGERLQKILASAGVASRRAAEELIAAGRVRVNGQVVSEMGVRADPLKDKIEVDGKPVATVRLAGGTRELVYVIMNKPEGIMTTTADTHGRKTVLDLLADAKLKERGLRIFPVGRLDAETTGLLLLTNDGDLTFHLTHPSHGVEKEYRALVRGAPNDAAVKKLREGVEILGELTAPARVEIVGRRGGDTWLRVVIHEGRKRQVRLMTASVGHPVISLQRVRFGPLTLGRLQPGQWRYLMPQEIKALKRKESGVRSRESGS